MAKPHCMTCRAEQDKEERESGRERREIRLWKQLGSSTHSPLAHLYPRHQREERGENSVQRTMPAKAASILR